MKKFLILTEGKADVVFLRDFIKHLLNSKKIQVEKIKREQKRIDYHIKLNDLSILIYESGGYKVLKKLKKTIESKMIDGYKIIVIQDADNPSKEDGGIENRTNYFNRMKKELNIDFEFFLFPNNKDDGDLEVLLKKIVNKEKYNNTLECYKEWSDCLSVFAEREHCEELLQDKNLIYNYFRTYFGMDNAKEENRVFVSEYWDFESEELEHLRVFLKERLNLVEN